MLAQQLCERHEWHRPGGFCTPVLKAHDNRTHLIPSTAPRCSLSAAIHPSHGAPRNVPLQSCWMPAHSVSTCRWVLGLFGRVDTTCTCARGEPPPAHTRPHLSSARRGSSAHSAALTQNSARSRMMSASTAPPKNTRCLRRGGSSTRSRRRFSPVASPCAAGSACLNDVVASINQLRLVMLRAVIEEMD